MQRTPFQLPSPKSVLPKRRKQTIAQILRDSYRRHCRDRETFSALRQCLRNE